MAILAVGLVGGFMAGRGSSGGETGLDGGTICGGADYEPQAAAFGRIVPEGANVTTTVTHRNRIEDGEYISRCLIQVDGSNALLIDTKVTNAAVETWQKNLWSKEITERQDLKQVTVGERGLSTPNSFAMYVRCGDLKDSRKKPLALSVAVTAQGGARSDSGEHRKDLADISVKAAGLADTEIACAPTNPLPDTAPRIS